MRIFLIPTLTLAFMLSACAGGPHRPGSASSQRSQQQDLFEKCREAQARREAAPAFCNNLPDDSQQQQRVPARLPGVELPTMPGGVGGVAVPRGGILR